MSRGWLIPGSSVALALLSLGTLVVSCADDSGLGCTSGCANGWTLCQSDLTSAGVTHTEFLNNCQAQCQRAAASNARSLATSLACLNQATDCTAAEECGSFGSVLAPPGFGFAGFGFDAGFFAGGFANAGGLFNGGGFFGTGGTIGTSGFPGCSDDCFYANNLVCDDGARGSSSARCAYGTDCSDCGVRALGTGGSAGTGGTEAGPPDGAAGFTTDGSAAVDGTVGVDGATDGAAVSDGRAGVGGATDGATRSDAR